MIRARICLLIALATGCIGAGFACRDLSGSRQMTISFLDIGQGDAIYMRAPSGRDMLVDGSAGPAVLEALSGAMPWYDRDIDVVIATHPDSDHIGGLPLVLSRYGVGMFIESGAPSKNVASRELSRLVAGRSIPRIVAKRGMRVDFGDGAAFDILFPDADMSSTEDTNAASVVGQMRYGATSFMLTGDSPKAVEDHLVSLDGSRLRSDVLKAGHHGSRTSSGEGYVKTVDPRYAVISAGKDNRYGHPHAETLALFGSLGVSVARTDTEGTVVFSSDGKEVFRR
jgi:competence protein ComEC